MNDIEETYDKFEMLCTFVNDDSHDRIEQYLKLYPELVSYNNSYFLKLITMTNKVELVKLFIKHGANIFDDNHTILYICASKKYYDMMEYVLSLGEDIENISCNDGYIEAKQHLMQASYI